MSLSKTQIFLFFESGNYVKECLCLIDTHLVGELFSVFIIWYYLRFKWKSMVEGIHSG